MPTAVQVAQLVAALFSIAALTYFVVAHVRLGRRTRREQAEATRAFVAAMASAARRCPHCGLVFGGATPEARPEAKA